MQPQLDPSHLQTPLADFWLAQVPAEIAKDQYYIHMGTFCTSVLVAISVIAAVVSWNMVKRNKDPMKALAVCCISGLFAFGFFLAIVYWRQEILQLQNNPLMWALKRLLERIN
jgi:hypothetical protein